MIRIYPWTLGHQNQANLVPRAIHDKVSVLFNYYPYIAWNEPTLKRLRMTIKNCISKRIFSGYSVRQTLSLRW